MKPGKNPRRIVVVKVRMRPDEFEALKRRFPRGYSTAMRRLALGEKLANSRETRVPRIVRGQEQERCRRWTELLSWTGHTVAEIHRTVCRAGGPVSEAAQTNAAKAVATLPEIFAAILEEIRDAR